MNKRSRKYFKIKKANKWMKEIPGIKITTSLEGVRMLRKIFHDWTKQEQKKIMKRNKKYKIKNRPSLFVRHI